MKKEIKENWNEIIMSASFSEMIKSLEEDKVFDNTQSINITTENWKNDNLEVLLKPIKEKIDIKTFWNKDFNYIISDDKYFLHWNEYIIRKNENDKRELLSYWLELNTIPNELKYLIENNKETKTKLIPVSKIDLRNLTLFKHFIENKEIYNILDIILNKKNDKNIKINVDTFIKLSEYSSMISILEKWLVNHMFEIKDKLYIVDMWVLKNNNEEKINYLYFSLDEQILSSVKNFDDKQKITIKTEKFNDKEYFIVDFYTSWKLVYKLVCDYKNTFEAFAFINCFEDNWKTVILDVK